MVKSSTMMYILRRHVGENDPSQPVCHDEEQCAERENSAKPPVKPEENNNLKRKTKLKKNFGIDVLCLPGFPFDIFLWIGVRSP